MGAFDLPLPGFTNFLEMLYSHNSKKSIKKECDVPLCLSQEKQGRLSASRLGGAFTTMSDDGRKTRFGRSAVLLVAPPKTEINRVTVLRG